jgi:predicted dehydrogenase
MPRIAVIGYGHWGPNLVRNFSRVAGSRVSAICDLDPGKLEKVRAHSSNLHLTTNYLEILEKRWADAVAIATYASAHYAIARDCLEAGLQVFVEKPMCMSEREAEELVDLARARKRTLMVGHLLKYHPAIRYLKHYLDTGKLGEPLYIYSHRLNLGEVRKEENAMWCLAPHDIAVVGYLLGQQPYEVCAVGESYLRYPIHDAVFLTLRYPARLMAHIHVSWLDPHKVRRMTVVGSRQMAVFDDMEPTEKLRIYDKGVDFPNGDYDSPDAALSLRVGDIYIPKLDHTEPLYKECEHFVECIRRHREPESSGSEGLNVVRVLEAAQKSLEKGGVPVPVNGVAPPQAEPVARPTGLNHMNTPRAGKRKKALKRPVAADASEARRET